MTVTVNGEQREVEDGMSIFGLLELLRLKPQVTIVEKNAEIVERLKYEDTPLADGDVLELVRLVGGG